ncbi:alkaline phosphatase family protein [Oryzihumus sp.]
MTKVLVVIEENHSLDQMRTQMPGVFRLAKRFGYATDYHAITHPSLPNYLALAGGSTFGVTDDAGPTTHPIHGTPSVFADALAHGRTAKVYADGMPSPCATADGGNHYAVKHNPWAYFVDERAACVKHDVPATRLAADAAAGRLPNVGLLVPNLCHDAHDCSLASADAWFVSTMKRVFAGPDWRSGRLAVVLTADEDDSNQNNTVLTAVLHRSQHHHVVHTRLDHYSLLRMLEGVVGAPHRGKAASVPSLADAFHLPVG